MVDLHTHSTASDGTFTQEELVKLAKKIGLSAIALTDHNTTAGLNSFLKAGKEHDIETIAGAEISTELDGVNFHILALFIDEAHYDDVESFVKVAIDRKIESNRLLVKNLSNAGYKISYDDIVESYGSEKFNRVAIANALLEKGYVSSISDAFSRLICQKAGYYIPSKKIDTLQTVSFIKDIGALPIWAHPLKDTSSEKIDSYLPKAKDAGLVGIEAMHCSYDKEKTKTAIALAKKHNLLTSGGSDFHGANKENVMLGTGTNNNVCVSDSVLDRLKEKL